MKIDHTIKKRRIQAVKLADALNAIEGVPVSDYAKELSSNGRPEKYPEKR